MGGIIVILPVILLIIVMWRFKKMSPSTMNLNKKWTFLFLAVYIGVLFIATITNEILTKSYSEQPKFISEEKLNYINQALDNGTLAADSPSLVIDKRTHKVGDTLSISTTDENSYPNITIEHKDVNDGLIEETIFKPQLVMDDYDLSDYFKYVLPKWVNDQVVFPIPPLTKVSLTSYEDSFLLKQFTSTPRESFGHSSSSMSREISVHLLVPKDLTIKADVHLYVDYVNE